MSTDTVTTTLDLTGLRCPLPIVKTAAHVKKMQPGESLEVLATDPGSVPDFKAWAKATGHGLVAVDQQDDVYRFVIRKKG